MMKRFGLLFGGAAIVSVGMAASLGACSSGDDSTTNDSGAKDSSVQDTAAKDTSTQDQSSQDAGSDVSAECGSTPTLHLDDAGTIFCGYPPDGGSGFSCGTGQQCCLGGKVGTSFDPEECFTWGGTCDNPLPDASTSPGAPIECNQNADCTVNGKANNVCCLQGASAPTVVAGCGYYKSSNGTGILCETGNAGACSGASDIQVCSQQSDCPQGKTCTPMKWKIYQLGFCM